MSSSIPTGTQPGSQDSQRTFPIVSQLPNDSFLSPTAAPSGSRRVLKREGVLCLPDCSASAQAAYVCCSRTSISGGAHVRSHINKKRLNVIDNLHSVASLYSTEFCSGLTFNNCDTNTAGFTKRTNVMSNINEDCLRYAQARGPLKILRTPGTPVFCTLLVNAKINPKQHSVRLYHSQSSSEDPSVKLRQSVSNQTKSCADASSTHRHETTEAQLTHTDAQGRATMVDVGGKVPTRRTATARATVVLGPTAFRLLQDNQLAKGDALTVAQIAGITASKQTSALIPLCHPLPLDHTSVTFHLDELQNAVVITATCRTTGRTGVEMEALTAVSVAALTVYDMCKAVSHDIIITDVKLVSKTGGKRDFHRHPTPHPHE